MQYRPGAVRGTCYVVGDSLQEISEDSCSE